MSRAKGRSNRKFYGYNTLGKNVSPDGGFFAYNTDQHNVDGGPGVVSYVGAGAGTGGGFLLQGDGVSHITLGDGSGAVLLA